MLRKIGDFVLHRKTEQSAQKDSPQQGAGSQLTRRRLLSTAAAGAAAMALPRQAEASSTVCADVVVIGAGFSGLAAALKIAKAGKSVLILEARDRVGGKVLNYKFEDGDITEGGGTYVGPTQNRMLALAAEYGVRLYPTYYIGKPVTVFEGNRVVGGFVPSLAAEFYKLVALLDAMSLEVPVAAPWTAANAVEWDSITLYSWLVNNNASPGALEVFSSVGDLFGAETRDLSLLFVLRYIAGAGDENTPGTLERLINVANGAQQFRFHGGSQLLAQLMARKLDKRIIFKTPARALLWSDDGVTIISESLTVQAKRVIMAISPVLAESIQYEPKLPTPRALFLQRYPMGGLMKVQAVYSRPFWREAGLSGAANLAPGPIRNIYDNSPPSGRFGILVGFVAGSSSRFWTTISPADRRAAALGCFASAFGDEALSPTDYLEFDWSSEQWSRGGPVGYGAPGVLLDFGSMIGKAVGPIHWAATEASDFWTGYMEGAVRSGERAAREVLSCLGEGGGA